MMIRSRTLTAALATTALLGLSAGAIGVDHGAGSTTEKSSKAKTTQAGKRAGRPHRGPGRLTTAQVDAIAAKLGVTSAQLKAALESTRPARPVDGGPRGDRGGKMAQDIATALNADVAKVKEILDANRPARPADAPRGHGHGGRHHGPRPNAAREAKLVTALATGLGLDEAAVKTALDGLRAAHAPGGMPRPGGMADALAAKLGVSAADVKAAFQSVLPAPPNRR